MCLLLLFVSNLVRMSHLQCQLQILAPNTPRISYNYSWPLTVCMEIRDASPVQCWPDDNKNFFILPLTTIMSSPRVKVLQLTHFGDVWT